MRFHQVYYPEFSFEVPYTVALAQLDEGPLMIATVEEDTELQIGERLAITFRRLNDDLMLPYFRSDGSRGN